MYVSVLMENNETLSLPSVGADMDWSSLSAMGKPRDVKRPNDDQPK